MRVWGFTCVVLAGCILLFTTLSCSENNFTSDPVTDYEAAYTIADPPGGTYWWTPTVTLRSNLKSRSIIYYTLDGSFPEKGGGSTLFGYSPIYDIKVEQNMQIKFLSENVNGDWEPLRVEEYTIDPNSQNEFFSFDTTWRVLPYGYGDFLFPNADGNIDEDYFQSWYLTGHLVGRETGHEYAFVLVYQMNVLPANQYYYRQFHLIDITAGRFYPETDFNLNPPFFEEKLRLVDDYMDLKYVHSKVDDEYVSPADEDKADRNDLDFYGAEDDDDEYNADHWTQKADPPGHFTPFEYHVDVYSEQNKGLALELEVIKPPAFPTGDGLITYVDNAGTRCYDYPLISAEGTITIAGVSEAVSGSAFMERLWNKDSFGIGAIRRYRKEWIALQLSSGHQLIIYQFYDRDDKVTTDCRNVTVIDPEGEQWDYTDFSLNAEAFFQADSHPAYPILTNFVGYSVPTRYSFSLPALDMNLTLTTPVENTLTSNYTEEYQPFCRASGTVAGERVTGVGWMDISRTWPSQM